VPVLGALFGTKDDNVSRTELVVLLTPRVVRNPEESRDMTNEISRKFQAVLLTEMGGMPRPRTPPPY